MSCAKMAEPIEMQFGMLCWVMGPRNIVWWLDPPPHGKRHFGRLKSTVKHRISEVG